MKKIKLIRQGTKLKDKFRLTKFVLSRKKNKNKVKPISINISKKSKIITREGMSNDIWACSPDYDKEFFDWFIKQKFKTTIDIGAYIGRYTLIFAETSGRVISFEPYSENFQALATNIGLNKRNKTDIMSVDNSTISYGNVLKINKGCYDRKGFCKLKLSMSNPGSNSIYFNRDGLSEEIEVVRLDDYDINNVDFIKIDAEGVELNILRGMEKTIDKFHPIIYLEILRQKEEIIDFMISKGYTSYKIFGEDNYLFEANFSSIIKGGGK
jgi:FkbM family methyltransferase